MQCLSAIGFDFSFTGNWPPTFFEGASADTEAAAAAGIAYDVLCEIAVYYLPTSSNSTSKINVALGGITPPAPLSP